MGKAKKKRENQKGRRGKNEVADRRTSLVWTLVVVLGLVGAGAAVFFWQQRQAPSKAPAITVETRLLLEEIQSHLDKRHFDSAIDAGLAYLEEHPDASGVHYALGIAYLAKRDDKLAIEALEEALRRAPDHPDALFGLASAYEGLGDLPAANLRLRRLLEIDPDDSRAALQLGTNLAQTTELDEAQAVLEQAVAAVPAEANFQLGMVLRKKRDLEGAAAAFRKALEAEPEYLGALYNLGQILVLQGQKQEGQRLLEYHTKLEERQWELTPLLKSANTSFREARNLVDLGNYYLEHQQPQEAITRFNQALEMDERNLRATLGLGQAFLEIGRLDDSAFWLERAIETEPENPRGHFLYGLVLHLGGRFEDARYALDRSRELAEWGATEYLFLGNAFFQTEARADARAAYETALRLNPGLSEIYYRLGLLNFLDGRARDAHAALSKKVEIDPDDSESLMLLGITYFRVGDQVAAEETFARARELHTLTLYSEEQIEEMLRGFATLPGSGPALDFYRSLG